MATVVYQAGTEENECPMAQFRVHHDQRGTKQLSAEVGTDSPIFTLSQGVSSFESEMRAPNAEEGDLQKICDVANAGVTSMPVRRSSMGVLVNPGCVKTLELNGQPLVVGPGRWRLSQILKLGGRVKWASQDLQLSSVTSGKPFEYNGLTLCRVGRAEIGLAFEHSTQAVLLAPGLHVYNTQAFQFVGVVTVQQAHCQHGSLHVLRVTRGNYALVWESPTQPRILTEGNYVINSATFRFDKMVSMMETYVQHGTIHIIQVPKGHVAKVTEDVTPKLLGEGIHRVDFPNFKFDGLQSLTAPVITHGTVTRFRVAMGEVAVTTWHNEPVFVEVPGTYEVDSPDFTYHRAEQVTAKLLQHRNKKLITVFSGEVGISYRGGQLDVLLPGRHVITAADHYFDCFLSTQQVTLRLKDGSNTKGDFLLAETKDFVKVGVRADVFYSIADAFKTITRVGKDGVHEFVTETAISTLTNIIRTTNLNEIAQSQSPSAQPGNAAEVAAAQAAGAPSAPLFFDKAHDEFLSRLHDDFLTRYGIEISNIRIEAFKIMDEQLSMSISKQAITTAETETALANLKGQTEIATAEQERQARVCQIRTEAEANAQRVQTESRLRMEIETAEAEAKVRAIRAQQEADARIAAAKAEAEAIRLRAEAEAGAIRVKAAAEAERAAALAATPLGSRLAMLELWGETVKSSNEGVSKVVYCDPSVQGAAAGNPLSLFGLSNVGSALSQLESMGETAGTK